MYILYYEIRTLGPCDSQKAFWCHLTVPGPTEVSYEVISVSNHIYYRIYNQSHTLALGTTVTMHRRALYNVKTSSGRVICHQNQLWPHKCDYRDYATSFNFRFQAVTATRSGISPPACATTLVQPPSFDIEQPTPSIMSMWHLATMDVDPQSPDDVVTMDLDTAHHIHWHSLLNLPPWMTWPLGPMISCPWFLGAFHLGSLGRMPSAGWSMLYPVVPLPVMFYTKGSAPPQSGFPWFEYSVLIRGRRV